jgi:hypothetical protein
VSEGAESHDDEIAAWDRRIAEHREESEPDSQHQVALALLAKGAKIAWQYGLPADALLVWDEVVRRFGASTDERLRWDVKEALFKKALLLIESGSRRDAARVYEQLLAAYSARVPHRARPVAAWVILGAVSTAYRLRLHRTADKLLPKILDWLPESHPAKP